ncbi:Deubiquitination-protection protein dph1 [Madurella fahalii]|uniref:Deubiquitination-protection protein dph1 n=1 Tax=Madurella fahalii TaxID=1157608 RepID=A0ABQ0FXK9_9PEZI
MADNGETGSDAQITFKVKTVGDKTHTITMSESATVLDLKTMLAEANFEDIPVERQRLIYSGRIMKDSDALSVYKIKSNNTIHLVKSARSNPTPATVASSSTPTPAAVPQNMAAGSSASDPLAGLTGARFAGLANLPSADLFGADGGMGAPPNEEQIAEILSNPMVAQTMNEALNNPDFIDYMIRSNPTLANVPNAREMLQSPYFRSMMTNPEALRMAARMRRMMQGDAAAFPAPGATDSTPADAPRSGGSAASGTNPAPGASQANPLAALLGFGPLGMAGPLGGGSATVGATAPSGQAAAPSEGGPGSTGANAQAGGASQPINPFNALFGSGQAGQAANAANPFGMPPISPEAMQQMAQMLGLGSLGNPSAPAPADDRPPEERYADQLRQLNDMGFFDFDRNVTALRRSGGSVQGAVEYLLSGQ